MNTTKMLILLIAFSVGAIESASFLQNSNLTIAQENLNGPIAPYEQPEIRDPTERALRELRNKHHERFTFGLPSLDQLGGGEHADCYAPGVREKLALEKDTVLVGEVMKAHTYFTKNKKHVYTEYVVRVNEVLKQRRATPAEVGMEIVAERWGGAVRFPKGEIRRYGVRTLGMPEAGQRYLFILEGHKDFYIWTAFRLSSGQISPIDKLDSKLLPLAGYKGSDESEFLIEVRKAISAVNSTAGHNM